MPLIEVVDDEPLGGPGPSTTADLLSRIRNLTGQLVLPDDLLPTFLAEDKPQMEVDSYRDHALIVLDQLRPLTASSTFTQLSLVEQSEVILPLLRIRGDEPCGSADLVQRIDDIIALSPALLSDLALHILQNPLRQLFTAPHPMLSTSTHRALSRPAGGEAARGDLHDDAAQQWKKGPAQGCQNVLAWCASQLSDAELEKHIGVVLPPTLTMMDDWEPAWRVRGVLVLESWVDRMQPETMRRMGMDRLLLDSIIHTLSLHAPNARNTRILGIALALIEKTCEAKHRSDRLGDIVQKAIVDGWQYAPSGAEGRVVLIQISEQLEMLCNDQALGEGIVRWLKDIVPNLLQPLQFSPSHAALLHFHANLSALLTVMRTIKTTGRIARWRGHILHVLGKLAIQLEEQRELDSVALGVGATGSEQLVKSVTALLRDVFDELARVCPAVIQDEYPRLLALDNRVFATLISTSA